MIQTCFKSCANLRPRILRVGGALGKGGLWEVIVKWGCEGTHALPEDVRNVHGGEISKEREERQEQGQPVEENADLTEEEGVESSRK